MNILSWLMKLIFLGVVTFTCYWASGDLKVYMDMASVLALFLPVFLLLLAFNKPAEIISYYKQSWEKTPYDGATARKGIVFFQTMMKIAIITGITMTLIGAITVLAQYKNPQKVGEAVAVALITTLYSLVFILAFPIPSIAALKKKIAANEEK